MSDSDDIRDLVRDPKCKPKFEALLRLAAGRGDVDQVKERLSWGIDPNCESKAGRTALICNVTSCCPSSGVARALLKAGADPLHTDHKGLTALDYARRKLARIDLRPRKPPRKSRSLDENNQLILSKFDRKWLDGIRRQFKGNQRKEYVRIYLEERLKAARRVFNDPVEVEKIIDLLEAAERKRGG
jgi:hypothetical protein